MDRPMAIEAKHQFDLAALPGRLDELERQVRGLEAELSYAQRLATLGLFAGSVAHEINGLLTPALVSAREALQQPGNAGELRQALEQSVLACKRAGEIASAILGYLTAEEAPVSEVRKVVDDAISCLGRPPARDGVELIVSVGAGLRASIAPVALQQVVMNLVSNALRAIVAGNAASAGGSGWGPPPDTRSRRGRQISIQARRSTWNTVERGAVDAVCLIVQDNGPGIPRAILERLFEPLAAQRRRAKGDVANERREGVGSGLGLSICKRLIEAAGGGIEAISAAGEGARFIVWIPAVAGGADAQGDRAAAATGASDAAMLD